MGWVGLRLVASPAASEKLPDFYLGRVDWPYLSASIMELESAERTY